MFTLTDHDLCRAVSLTGRLPSGLNPGHNLVGLSKRSHGNKLDQRRTLHAMTLIFEDNRPT